MPKRKEKKLTEQKVLNVFYKNYNKPLTYKQVSSRLKIKGVKKRKEVLQIILFLTENKKIKLYGRGKHIYNTSTKK